MYFIPRLDHNKMVRYGNTKIGIPKFEFDGNSITEAHTDVC